MVAGETSFMAQYFDQAVDYRDSFTASIHQLENQLDELNAQRRNEEGLKQSMNFLDSLAISTTADDEMVARFHQQVDAEPAAKNVYRTHQCYRGPSCTAVHH